MRHKAQLQIRWADLDAFKHVNNASYLVYMQEARADFTWFSRIAKGEQLKPSAVTPIARRMTDKFHARRLRFRIPRDKRIRSNPLINEVENAVEFT